MSNKKKTLVVLTPGFPSSEADTTCLPMQQHFIRSVKAIYPALNIVILSFQYPYFKKTYCWHNMKVISYSGKNKGGIARLLLRRNLYNTLRDIHTDSWISGILSFWCGECAYVGKKFSERFGIPHYCWIMGQDAKKNNEYPKKIKLHPGELIALSDFLQEEFEKNHGILPQHVIPPGRDNVTENIAAVKKDIDLFAAGSLIPLKRYDLFLEIVAELKKQDDQIIAMLAGDGPERKRLEQLAKKLGLETNLQFCGELPYPEVLQLMQRSKLFLHPSSYEGFSGTCLEALHNGAQVISFCKPMNHDIEQWRIVRSKEEMREQAWELLKNPPAYYNRITVYPIDGVVKRVMGLFDI